MAQMGLIQMTSGPNAEENLRYMAAQISQLAQEGAQLILCPENALVFGSRADYYHYAEALGDGPLQQKIAALAKQLSVWVVIGSMPIRTSRGVETTMIVFDHSGSLVGHYAKLHMFDVDVADGHRRYRESETFTAGQQIVTVSTPFAHLGLSICYDVRFPPLYTELARLGANVLLVPAAFTAVTGRAHWEALLKARAIETQSWVVAANQVGTHPCGRQTWGHSMVVSPWGEVVANLTDQPANLLVDINVSQVDELRAAMPVLQHSRFNNQLKN